MRPTGSRFTIRRMLLAVAVFAVALHLGLSYRLAGEYRRRALFYTRAGETALFRAQNVESGEAHLDGYTAEEKRNVVDQARRFVVYADQLKAKYERAVYIPWLPIESDPPPPGVDTDGR
jgi:hypothetical protein